MSSMIEIIKRAALDAVNQSKPVKVEYGTVTSIEPFQIQINQKIILEADHLVATPGVFEHEMGTRLILLQIQGGQKYMVISREGAE